MKIDIDQIKVLLDMVSEADIAELTIEVEEERITIKKPAGGAVVSVPHIPHHELAIPNHTGAAVKVGHGAASAEIAKTSTHEGNNSDKEDHLVAITAPMVGTFYRASSPSTPAYVEAGDKVAVGQTVCIIEAMKLMNDLPSEIAGRIVKICAENGATVEYGQQLFLVDPKA